MAQEPCPHCGRPFDHDNAGARTQHVKSCQGAANGGAVEPERVHETAVAQPDDDPVVAAQKDAVRDGVNIVGGILEKIFEHRNRLKSAKGDRAQQANLTKAEQYPACVECGYQFGPDELDGAEVRCPDCRTLWEIEVV